MSIAYATPERAREVVGLLKGVQAKLKKKEQVHLPAFLNVDGDAPYKVWLTKFKEVKKRAVNTGQDAVAKLCVPLEHEFKSEPTWRGLLNSLGRLQIEEDVAQLAATKHDLRMRSTFFAYSVDQLQVLVGSPDAAAVVSDVFKSKNLEVPTQQAPPEPTPAPEPGPSRELATIPPEIDVEEQEPVTASGPKSFWQALGGLLVSVAAERIQAAVAESRQTADIQGSWRGVQAGTMMSIAQRGNYIEAQGNASRQSFVGQGTIRGRKVELVVSVLPFYQRQQVLLEVSPDGSRMFGTARDDFGRTIPIDLRKGA